MAESTPTAKTPTPPPAKPVASPPTGKAPAKPSAATPGTPKATKKTPALTTTPKGKTEAKDAKDVKIVDKPTPKKHVARPKPTLTERIQDRLRLRTAIDGRRPRFRRQQWYEYKRLADSGWRKPTGVDSAMRRHFGYEQSVVRIGFRGPVETRGLHPSGFQEVRVETLGDLARIDPKKQAARVSGNLGTRTLKLVYAEADKLKIRVLNRRNLE